MQIKSPRLHLPPTPVWVIDGIRIVIIAIVYFAVHHLSSLFPDTENILYAVWPAAGIGLASLLLNPRRLWFPILLGLFIAGSASDIIVGRPFFNSLGFMTANILESLISASTLIYICGPNIRFTRIKEILVLILVAIFVNAFTALIGAGTASRATNEEFWHFWGTWYIADGLGMLVVTPLVIAWHTDIGVFLHSHWKRILESTFFLAVWAIAVFLTFNATALLLPIPVLPYLLFALLTFASLRFSLRGATTAMFILSVILITSHAVTQGPLIWGGGTLEIRLQFAQLFIASAAITSFLINATLSERHQAERDLRSNQALLLNIINSVPQAIFWKDLTGTYLGCNTNFAHSLNLDTPAQVVGLTDFELSATMEEAEAFRAADLQVINQNQPLHHILNTTRTPAGDIIYSDTTKLPLLDKKGSPFGLLGVFEDITERLLTTAALRESEEKYRDLVNNISDGILETDLSGRITVANLALAHMFGYNQPEPILGRNFLEFLHPSQVQEQAKLFYQLTENGMDVGSIRFDFVRLDGQHAFAEARPVPILKDGQVIGTRGAIRDITQQKIAEELLRESEQRFRTIIENAPIAISIGRQGKLLFANSAYVHLHGYTSEQEVLGHFTLDFVAPEDQQISSERASQREEGRYQYDTPYELLGLRKDGTRLHLLVALTRVNLPDGPANIAFIQDFTSRKQSEEALRKSEAKFRAVVEQSNDGILFGDQDATILYRSPSYYRINGFTDAEHLGQSGFDTIHPEDLERFRAWWASLIQHPATSGRAEYRIHHKAGDWRWVDSIGQNLLHNSDVQAIVITTRDITERKHIEEELRAAHAGLEQRVTERTAELNCANQSLARALRARDEFTSAMSHELRTPLTGVIGLSEVLQMSTYGPLTEKQLKAVVNIEQSGQRLLSVINDVINYTILQSGTLTVLPKPHSLENICLNALRSLTVAVAKKHQRTHFASQPEHIIVNVDELRLDQILTNLLHNANKFTPDGGEFGIEVLLDPSTAAVAITVWDTGIGIPPDDFPRLFQPFVQLDASLSRQYEGTGLGLALVKQITDLLGGTITVTSTPGQGSRFTLTLPC